ncbi:WYL domain-containing protein [Kosakonia sacchari]|uniref:WYL domain-containing protein n=1 Tax=Kosakonia sacchari TaxID=1158459 RepID=UPI0025AF0A58|nr:WYL domain-containing protein [Kosakonia sacchari]MDN2487882.1 WYL domain-containing protein [Kosakonia sacchari]
MSSAKLPHERLAFIEMIAFWMGEVRNKDLENQFGITRQQAYKDFIHYQNTHPGFLLKLDKSRYRFTDDKQPYYFHGGLDDFLIWLETGQFVLAAPLSNACATRLKLPERKISRQIIATLIKAIHQQLRIEVNYTSLSNPENEGRIFSPHSIIKAGSRFHVRGYCEKSQGFRDLVLSRFRGNAEIEGPSPYSIAQDEAWQTLVTLVLAPDPRLSPTQRNVLANDYQMENNQLCITTRAALADYLLKEMQVNRKYLDGNPEAQQLVLVNGDDIKRWLFNS